MGPVFRNASCRHSESGIQTLSTRIEREPLIERVRNKFHVVIRRISSFRSIREREFWMRVE
jgi:hypothetical protein